MKTVEFTVAVLVEVPDDENLDNLFLDLPDVQVTKFIDGGHQVKRVNSELIEYETIDVSYVDQ